MLKIIGIPSEQEALTLYNECKQERDEWNRESKVHDTILIFSVILVYVLSIVGIFWSCGWIFTIEALGPLRIFGLLAADIIGFFVILGNLNGQREYDEFSWPLKYKYYVKTRDKNILETKLDDDALYFVLENDKHEVETELFAVFKKKCRTDIDEIVVDLNNAEILLPYKKS